MMLGTDSIDRCASYAKGQWECMVHQDVYIQGYGINAQPCTQGLVCGPVYM